MTESSQNDSQYNQYLEGLVNKYKKLPQKTEIPNIPKLEITQEDRSSKKHGKVTQIPIPSGQVQMETEQISDSDDSSFEKSASSSECSIEQDDEEPQKAKEEQAKVAKVDKGKKIKKNKKQKDVKQWNKDTMKLDQLCVPKKIKGDSRIKKKQWVIHFRYQEKGVKRSRAKCFFLSANRNIDKIKKLYNQVKDLSTHTVDIDESITKLLRPLNTGQEGPCNNILDIKFWKENLINSPFPMREAFNRLWLRLCKEGYLEDFDSYE